MWKILSCATGGDPADSVMTFARFSSTDGCVAGGEGRRAAASKGESRSLGECSESDWEEGLFCERLGKRGD